MRWGARLGLMTTSVLVVVVAFEAAVRLWIPGWAPPAGDRRFWAYDPLLGWRHVPGRSGLHQHPDFRVRVDINDAGLRDRDYPTARTQRDRMLFLGDSFGWGFGVERDESVSELLEARHPGWEIVNASVSGYGTDQQLLWYREEGFQYQPDVVFVLFHPNDFHDNSRYSRYGYRKPLFEIRDAERLELTEVPVERRPTRARIERWLVHHVALYPRLDGLIDDWSERFWAEPEPAPAPKGAGASRGRVKKAGVVSSKHDPGEHPKRITARLLTELRDEVERRGARLVVASVPMWDAPRAFLARTLDELGVPYLPLDDAFDGIAREHVKFPNDAHWSPGGHRVAAEAIERFLVDEEVFVSPLEMARTDETGR